MPKSASSLRGVRRRAFLFIALLSCLLACVACKRKPTADPAADAAGAIDASAPASRGVIEALPIGHWESRDEQGSKLCLTLMSHGFYRVTATVPHYRNDARVSGRILEARAGKTPRSFDITLGVRSIIAKEIGRCRKNWVDYRLPAADVLGVRMTPTEEANEGEPPHERDDPWTSARLDDGGPAVPRVNEPPKRFSIQFDEAFETVEMCAAVADQPRDADATRCRTLKRATSPSTKMFAGSSHGCKTDGDCARAYEGEMCAPCKCMNVAFYPGDHDSDQHKLVQSWLTSARDAEQQCHLPSPIPPECPKCIDTVARCVDHTCKLLEKDGG